MTKNDFAEMLVRDQQFADQADHLADLAEKHRVATEALLMLAREYGKGDAKALEAEIERHRIAEKGWRHAAWCLREAVRLNRQTYEMLTGGPPRPSLKVIDPDDPPVDDPT